MDGRQSQRTDCVLIQPRVAQSSLCSTLVGSGHPLTDIRDAACRVNVQWTSCRRDDRADTTACRQSNSIVVKFELFELYYWLELYELYKVHKVKNANNCVHNIELCIEFECSLLYFLQ